MQILPQVFLEKFSIDYSLLNQWYKFSCSDLFDDDTTIENMDSFFVHTTTNCGFCCQDSYLLITSLYDCFGAWYCHSENMTTRKDLLLEPPECMHTCSIASKYHNISSASKEFLYAEFCEFSDFISLLSTIGSMLLVSLENHGNMRKFSLKLRKYYLPTHSRIKKSKNHSISVMFFHLPNQKTVSIPLR